MEPRKAAIMQAIDKFVAQRPGLEFGNYGDVSAYRSEMRSITRDRHDYNTLARAVERSDSITADALLRATRTAYSGRLTIIRKAGASPEDLPPEKWYVEYMTGQYFPTEYRKAACAVLASALWEWARDNAMPPVKGYRVESWTQLGAGRRLHTVRDTRTEADNELEKLGGADYGHVNAVYLSDRFQSAGDWLRAYFRREFGRSIANRWFS